MSIFIAAYGSHLLDHCLLEVGMKGSARLGTEFEVERGEFHSISGSRHLERWIINLALKCIFKFCLLLLCFIASATVGLFGLFGIFTNVNNFEIISKTWTSWWMPSKTLRSSCSTALTSCNMWVLKDKKYFLIYRFPLLMNCWIIVVHLYSAICRMSIVNN